MNVLWRGSRGPAVSRLQTRLTNLGYAGLDDEGVFGAATRKAVVAFQRSRNLMADGLAGPRTLASLKLLRPDAAAKAHANGLPQIFISYSHADAKWMKRL